jgi:Flp pilus assembly protein TadG
MFPVSHNTRSCQRGVAIVEFTIALPLLLLLLLATAEVGRLLSQYDTLTKSVRDASRYVAGKALNAAGVVSISTQLRAETGNLVATGSTGGSGTPLLRGLSASNVTVANLGNGYVSVSVAYAFTPMLGASLPTFGLRSPISLAIPLKATVIMRAL